MAKAKQVQFTDEDDALLSELGVELEGPKVAKHTPREERIIAGFEEVQRFVQEHGRRPRHAEDGDIFERLYAVRLDRIRASPECVELLKPLDTTGLLVEQAGGAELSEPLSDDELLEALGVEADAVGDLTEHRHVRPNAQRQAPDEVAQRKPCDDFEQFRPLFKQVQQELDAGMRRTVRFQHNGTIAPGDLFILDGQKVLVAGSGRKFVTNYQRENRRLRVIFDNGTEANLLLRSLQRALYKDAVSRRILPLRTEEKAAPLFMDQTESEGEQAGTIYVVRSLSDHPFIAAHRALIHKIGVTGGQVKDRLANARKDPTFLLADVEVVATYQLTHINRKALESLLHRFFSHVRLDLKMQDRFGSPVEAREWFLAPFSAIDEAIGRIQDGSIDRFRYDPENALLIQA